MLLADRLADALKATFGSTDDTGFSYLRSHGSLDQEHVAFFQSLVNGFEDPAIQTLIIEQSRLFYRLYGAIFQDLGQAVEYQHAV